MKISYNWLKQYVSTNKTPEELSEILTNTGLEVEGLESFESIEGGLEGLVVGEVLTKEKHPDADRLAVTTVSVGSGEPLDIVCGAPNVAIGQKVVVATVGTMLYPSDGEAFKIKKSKIRGAVSEGMICAEDEIGLGAGHDGIMVLDPNTKVGTPASELFEVESDFVFEIGLTPNRSDAMGHIGAARDVVAALNAIENAGLALVEPKVNSIQTASNLPISVTVENEEACPRYSGVVLKNIKVESSPTWLQNRLKAVGVRPINNVVDITNFVLKEMGQPLHAFDYETIEDAKVIVKTLKDKTKFIALDGTEQTLSSEDLMICSGTQAMCIAGVFGGEKSGVTNKTTSIFLESAYFDKAYVRKTSTRLGLRTDAAARYEKGADPELTITALQRAVDLLQEYAHAEVASEVIDLYPKKIAPAKVTLNLARLERMMSIRLETNAIKSILNDLDIKVLDESATELGLEIPLYRNDVTREADVFEEIMRIYGFNNIPVSDAVSSTLSFNNGFDKNQFWNNIAERLTGLGFNEITTNSISKSSYYQEEERASLVTLENSMTAELDIMRKSMLPDALVVIAHNINRKNSSLQLFELGSTYNLDYSQNQHLALYETGSLGENNWYESAGKSSYFGLKGSLDALLKNIKLDSGIEVSELTDSSEFAYGLSYSKNGNPIAQIGAVAPQMLKAFDINQDVFYANVNWDRVLKLARKQKIKFEEISKFPKVQRDLALIVDESVSFDAIQKVIRKSGGKMLQSVSLFDVFKDSDKIGDGKTSYAVSFGLLNKEKTLTDKEIDKIFQKIMRNLEEELNAVIRK